MTLKQILLEMVPYISFAYAEHALKVVGADANAKATTESIPILIKVMHSIFP